MVRWWLKQVYSTRWLWPLWPLSFLYGLIMRARRLAYRSGILRTNKLPVPLWVVGNITLGGTGKTALVIYLLHYLKRQGLKPGVVSRGYGGSQSASPRVVTAGSRPEAVGDEAVLMVKKSQFPMVVGTDRVAAAQHLLKHFDCNVIISDDGLQHLALGRDVEICVIDGSRGLGNGWCLPAGPLREGAKRLDSVDCVVYHGDQTEHAFWMIRQLSHATNLQNRSKRQALSVWKGQPVQLLTAIGNPDRLIASLHDKGLQIVFQRLFPDHYMFQDDDLKGFNPDLPILVTEKDATKLDSHLGLFNIWSIDEDIQISAQLNGYFQKTCYALLEARHEKGD